LNYKKLLYFGSYLLMAVVFLYAKVTIFNIDREKAYNDTPSYAAVAEEPLTASAFWVSRRPITLPLIYKILGINEGNYKKSAENSRVGKFQAGLSILSWLVLGLSLASTLKTRWLKPLAFGLIAFFSLSLEISQWDRILLSESVSNSLFVLLVALGLLEVMLWTGESRASQIQQWVACGSLILVAVLYSFTRDVNRYLFLFLSIGMLLGLFFRPIRQHKERVYFGLIAASFLLIFIAQDYSVNQKNRGLSYIKHVLVDRILPKPEAVAYFRQKGMPVSEDFNEFVKTASESEYLAALQTPAMAPLAEWIRNDAKSIYIQYLISTFPTSFLKPIQKYELLTNSNSSEYRRIVGNQPRWVNILDRILYPRSNGPLFLGFVVSMGVAVLLSWRYASKPAWIIIMILLVTIYLLMFIVWHGDTVDMERHATPVGIQLRLTFWMMVALLADVLVYRYG